MKFERVVKALLIMKEKGPTDVDFGICFNLTCKTGEFRTQRTGIDGYLLVAKHAASWEHYSGNPYFPVALDRLKPLWEGEGLELRHSLIDHIIAKLEA
tara:strand:- start:5906 stop:6199 length:294 start_codon:yes stop_codon:yes gene_type:complete